MPTFRKGYLEREEGEVSDSIIPVNNFNEMDFYEFLKANNYLLLLKLHPQEEGLYKTRLSKYKDHIYFLNKEKLIKENMDLYEILPHTDMLITDYSSVYFDYLLLNKPIVFINTDLEKYRETRGLLLEPYDQWTPGLKVREFEELIKVIKNSFSEDTFIKQRKELIDIFHTYKDGKSTERLEAFIKEILNNNQG